MSDNSTPPKAGENQPANQSENMGVTEEENESLPYEVVPNQPRPPRDMKGLLRFAMEATTAIEDAPSTSSHLQPMDEERKNFLQSALKEMTVDLIEVLTKALNKLKTVSELKPDDDPDEYEEALETISDTVDSIDLANDFHKIGGFAILMPCLKSSHTSLQWRAAELIAELTQNNPYCQSKIFAADLLPVLLEMVDNGGNEAVRVKALFAVSCIIRDYPDALRKFTELDGYSVLLRAMQSDIEKLKVKASFLLSALCQQHPAIRDDLQKIGWVHQLAGLINTERTTVYTHEYALLALLSLIRDHNAAIEDCRDPNLQLRSILTSFMESVKGKEECLEEIDYAQQIINIVFSDDNSCGER